MKNFKDKIGSKYTPKRTKLHHLKKILGGACPRTPLAKRIASPCAACRFATQISKSDKKYFLTPSPPKSWLRPCIYLLGSARPEVRGTAEPHGGAYPP